MWRLIVNTPYDRVATLLRLTLAIVIFPHGAQKAMGWFGGPGFSGTLDMFRAGFGIPASLAVLVVLAEFLGSLFLFIGLFARVASLGIGIVMLVATFLVHLPNGFFMNWAGTQAGEGFEFHLLALGISLAVLIRGAGAYSIDHALTASKEREVGYFNTAVPRPI